MDFQVLYTKSALRDLEEVLDWSWDQHPGTTQRFGISLLNHVDMFKSFPRLGAPVKGYPGVLRFFHSPFHVYYHLLPEQKCIEVLHFWHRSRRQNPP